MHNKATFHEYIYYTGLVSYFVDISQSNPRQHPNAIRKISTKQDFRVSVRLEDKAGVSVATSSGESGVLRVTNAKLWWPFTMVSDDSNAGYRYTLVVYKYMLWTCVQ